MLNRTKQRFLSDILVRIVYHRATFLQIHRPICKQAGYALSSKLVGAVLALIGITSGLIHFYDFWTKGQFPGAALLAITYFCVLFVAVLVYALLQDYRLGRKSRYAEALREIGKLYEEIGKLHAGIRDIDSNTRINDIKVFESAGDDLMEGIVKALGITSSAIVSACVKILIRKQPNNADLYASDSGRLAVRTLFRDRDSKDERKRYEDGKNHWIDENTSLRAAFTDDEGYFFCNDLSKYHGYCSTAVKAKGMETWTVPWSVSFLRRKWEGWKIPFRSEMIVAILTPGTKNDEKRWVRAFLCVDSRSRGVFDERYSIDILRGIAMALGPWIAQFHKNVEENKAHLRTVAD